MWYPHCQTCIIHIILGEAVQHFGHQQSPLPAYSNCSTNVITLCIFKQLPHIFGPINPYLHLSFPSPINPPEYLFRHTQISTEITAGEEYIPQLRAKATRGSWQSIANFRCSSDTLNLWRARSNAWYHITVYTKCDSNHSRLTKNN